MDKRRVVIFVFTFLLLMAGSCELSAQSLFTRFFKNPDKAVYFQHRRNAKQKQAGCGEMPAYNKLKAYKRYKAPRRKNPKLVPARDLVKRTNKPVQRDSTAVARGPGKPGTPPQKRVSSKTPPPTKPGSGPPANKTSAEKPPLISNASPVPPKLKDSVANVKRNVVPLTREQLKKMTLEERRDTLERITPTIVLPPIQFISDQDEFSVVNMDSFMQAMEYAQQGKVVLIEGHTDDLGSDAYNLKLSMKRAEKIRQLLLSGDVGDELISVIGYGERQPVVPNTSDANRAINRRIEFKIFSIPD